MPRFIKPTLEELRSYAREIGFRGFDAARFLDHYEMVGWVVGRARTPMASWRAAVRTWARNQAEWAGAPAVADDPAIAEYAKLARLMIASGGKDIGRFWAKVRDAVGEPGLARVRALAAKGGPS